MDRINNYTGKPYYYDEWFERQRKAAEIKKANKEAFNTFKEELNAVIDNKCDVCYQRYVCRYKNKGNCPTPQPYFSSELHDKQVRNEAFEEMLKLSEEWKNNGGSFLDFQRALRQKLKGLNND